MNLWIRSQDRRDLVKVESVILCFNEEKPDNGYSLKDKNDRWYPDILGTYKTKERALEVLDEIQKLLMPQVKVIHNKMEQEKLQNFSSNIIIQPMIEDIQIKQASSYVYEMPKE